MLINTTISSNLRSLGRVKVTVGKAVAEAVATGIWEEFQELLLETPQWTGTAAASWNIGFGMSAGGGKVRTMPERSRADALHAGHLEAVSIAEMANYGVIEEFIESGYRYGDLVVWNDAPSADRAEHGPLRKENDPPGPGAFARFERRVLRRQYLVYRDILAV